MPPTLPHPVSIKRRCLETHPKQNRNRNPTRLRQARGHRPCLRGPAGRRRRGRKPRGCRRGGHDPLRIDSAVSGLVEFGFESDLCVLLYSASPSSLISAADSSWRRLCTFAGNPPLRATPLVISSRLTLFSFSLPPAPSPCSASSSPPSAPTQRRMEPSLETQAFNSAPTSFPLPSPPG